MPSTYDNRGTPIIAKTATVAVTTDTHNENDGNLVLRATDGESACR